MENLFEFFHFVALCLTYQSLDHSCGLHFTFTLQLHTCKINCKHLGICVVFALCCDTWNKLDGETILLHLVIGGGGGGGGGVCVKSFPNLFHVFSLITHLPCVENVLFKIKMKPSTCGRSQIWLEKDLPLS